MRNAGKIYGCWYIIFFYLFLGISMLFCGNIEESEVLTATLLHVTMSF